MNQEEIIKRMTLLFHEAIDRIKHWQGRYDYSNLQLIGIEWKKFKPGLKVTKIKSGSWSKDLTYQAEARWYHELKKNADNIINHKFSYFNLKDYFHGNPIDWNRDHSSGKTAPIRFASSIDYRDFTETGDCKLVWEPNRHHQLVVLGRAYRATGKIVYAVEIKKQIESWIMQCPFGKGMNWRSPMELAIRMINWVWAIDLIYDSGIIDSNFGDKILNTVNAHLQEITKKYSSGTSANNHLIGEAAGVYITSSYFDCLPEAKNWKIQSKKILIDQIFKQTYDDGGGREQAFGYQLFVMQFFIYAAIVGYETQDKFAQAYYDKMEKMIEFTYYMAEGGDIPMIGDCDDGYVLDLGNRPKDLENLLCIGSILFNRSDFKSRAKKYEEAAYWLLGPDSKKRFDEIEVNGSVNSFCSRALKSSGYFLIQAPVENNYPKISILIDCGDLGYGTIAAHGHADALSFVLRLNEKPVFIDLGTYDYFTYAEWRKYFRSSNAHNTLVIDGKDQSQMTGPFMWGHKAVARCLHWSTNEIDTTFIGEHDGYERLSDPVRHTRAYHFNRHIRTLLIRDRLNCKDKHDVTVCFHLSPGVHINRESDHSFRIEVDRQILHLTLDTSFDAFIYNKDTKTKFGWASSGYHIKHPTNTIIGSAKICGDCIFDHRIDID